MCYFFYYIYFKYYVNNNVHHFSSVSLFLAEDINELLSTADKVKCASASRGGHIYCSDTLQRIRANSLGWFAGVESAAGVS